MELHAREAAQTESLDLIFFAAHQQDGARWQFGDDVVVQFGNDAHPFLCRLGEDGIPKRSLRPGHLEGTFLAPSQGALQTRRQRDCAAEGVSDHLMAETDPQHRVPRSVRFDEQFLHVREPRIRAVVERIHATTEHDDSVTTLLQRRHGLVPQFDEFELRVEPL